MSNKIINSENDNRDTILPTLKYKEMALYYLHVCHNTQGDPRWLPILEY